MLYLCAIIYRANLVVVFILYQKHSFSAVCANLQPVVGPAVQIIYLSALATIWLHEWS